MSSAILNPLDGRSREVYRRETQLTAQRARASLAAPRVAELDDETLDMSDFNAWADAGQRRKAVDVGVKDKDRDLRLALGEAGVRHMESVRHVSGALHAVVVLLASQLRATNARVAELEASTRGNHEALDSRVAKVAENLDILAANVSGMDVVSEEEQARLDAEENEKMERAIARAQKQRLANEADAAAAREAAEAAMIALGLVVATSHSRPTSATKDGRILVEESLLMEEDPKAHALGALRDAARKVGKERVAKTRDDDRAAAEAAAAAAARADRDREQRALNDRMEALAAAERLAAARQEALDAAEHELGRKLDDVSKEVILQRVERRAELDRRVIPTKLRNARARPHRRRFG